MKVFQIFKGLCHWDATNEFPTLADTEGRFASNIVFVEAPDYVHEGWGFDEEADGDDRFIQPTAPEGWLYDEATGTFYPESTETTTESKKSALEAQIAALQAELAALTATEE